jgi:hypothetical protein
MQTLLTRRIKAQGFIIFDDYGSRYSEFTAAMGPWVKEGKVKFLEDVVDGFENTPEAFIGLLTGRNFGKLVIRVSSHQ